MSKRKKKKNQNNSSLYFIAVVAILVAGFIYFTMIKSPSPNQAATTNVDSVSVTGDQQYIDVTVQGNYSPSYIEAKANTDTILRMNSKNNFGCASSFTIPKLGIRKNLPANGTTEISLGKQNPGTEIVGTCSMGMYRFTMKFV